MLNKNVYTAHISKASTRDGFGTAIVEAGEKNDKIVVLSGDLANSTQADKFEAKFPKRFFEIGIAEQNMASIAAGLALEGKIPFITSFGVFSPGRNWDQIRMSICYSGANVKIFGSHIGFSNAGDGASSQALEDIAIMRVLPGMTVLHPVDSIEMGKAVHAAIKHNGPVYIRAMREPTPVFTLEKTPFEIGKAQVLREGSDITIIATGPSVYEALLAAHEVEKRKGISVEVINSASIKPLDEETILKSAQKTNKVITVEEHQIAGGLGGAVTEFLSQKYPIFVHRLGANDTFGESGSYHELLEKYGLDAHCIVKKVYDILKV